MASHQLQLRAQRRFALGGLFLDLTQFLLMALLAQNGRLSCFAHFALPLPLLPLRPFARPMVQALPVICLHHQLDMLLLGQRDVYGGKRRSFVN